MPSAAPRPCAQPGCGVLVRGASRCPKHQAALEADLQQRSRAHDRQRGGSSARGYGSAWQRARARFLREQPLCVACGERHVISAATEVDHIVPHRGDMSLFWQESNWQPLCKSCHSAKTAREDGGFGLRRRAGRVGASKV